QLPGEQLEIVSRDEPRGHLVRWQRACVARYLRTNRIKRQPGGGLVAPEGREYRGIAIRSPGRRGMPEPVGKQQAERRTAPLGLAQEETSHPVEPRIHVLRQLHITESIGFLFVLECTEVRMSHRLELAHPIEVLHLEGEGMPLGLRPSLDGL